MPRSKSRGINAHCVHSATRKTGPTALIAAAELGDGVRVVSMPCMDVFNRQSQEYKDEV